MAEVYWIHLPHHDNITTQGYIGVTTRDPNMRLAEHVKRCENPYLKNAFEHNIDLIKIKTLLVASEEYCYEIEIKLRPETNIGWNHNKGGDIPPKQKGKTFDLSEDERKRRSERISSLNKRRVGELNPAKDPAVRAKISLSKAGSNNHMYGIKGVDHPRFGAIGAAKDKLWYYDPLSNKEQYYPEGSQPQGWVKGRKKRR